MSRESLGALFWEQVSRLGGRAAQRVKTGGGWTDVSWRELGDEVREVALGLIALGRQPREAVGLLSQTRAEWVRADFAILSVGAVTIPVYPTYPPETLAYIARDSEARTLFVEDAQQLAKALAAAPEIPSLDSVVVMHGAAPAGGRQRPAARHRLGGAPGAGPRTASLGRPGAARSGRSGPGTSRRSSTRRGPPARRRASCRPTGTTSPRST